MDSIMLQCLVSDIILLSIEATSDRHRERLEGYWLPQLRKVLPFRVSINDNNKTHA